MADVEDELVAHRETVRELMSPGRPLAIDSPHRTDAQPRWFNARGERTAERRTLHDRLLAEFRAEKPDVAADRQAIVLAGPPGAGKSTVKNAVLGEDESTWLSIDPDHFKGLLLDAAIADGSYEAVIKPDEIKELEAAGQPFAPLELASLVHEESSILAKEARSRAVVDGLNIVVDTVLSKESSAAEIASQLTEAGYSVRVIDVECTYEVSMARVEHRWRESLTKYRDGQDEKGLGGRWVPSEYARSLYPPELEGTSVTERIARTMAEKCPAVTRYELHRVDIPAGSPQLETVLERARPGAPLGASHVPGGAALRSHATSSSRPTSRRPPTRDAGVSR